MTPTLIYCCGKNRAFPPIAAAAGFRLGAQVPCTTYNDLYFADQDFKRPDRAGYMAALEKHRPHMATVLDWERPEQLAEVLEWAEDAAAYVEQVLIVPKVVGLLEKLPHIIGGKRVVLAYSIPTRYGGTPVPLWEFAGRPLHLLGGSPQTQIAYYCMITHTSPPAWLGGRAKRWLERHWMFGGHAKVYSVDGNMHQQQAHACRFWTTERRRKGHWVQLQDVGDGDWSRDANSEAFRRSCQNIKDAWHELGGDNE